jgi:hypothetical protein
VYDPDPDRSSGPLIHQMLVTLGYTGVYTDNLSDFRNFLGNFDAVFVCLGVTPNDVMIPLGSPDAESLVNYVVEHKGNLYMEGGDTWFNHPGQGGHPFHPYFLISPVSDGNHDLSEVDGVEGTLADGLSYRYDGDNDSLDRIEPVWPAQSVLLGSESGFGCGIAQDGGNFHTLGMSFELGGLRDEGGQTKLALIASIMEFFGLDTGRCGDTSDDGIVTPSDGYIILNYLGGGPSPASCWAANVNGDDQLTPSDGFNLLNHLGGGPPLDCQPCVFGPPR